MLKRNWQMVVGTIALVLALSLLFSVPRKKSGHVPSEIVATLLQGREVTMSDFFTLHEAVLRGDSRIIYSVLLKRGFTEDQIRMVLFNDGNHLRVHLEK